MRKTSRLSDPMTTTKTRSGTSQRYYKPERITQSEARRVSESRDTYLNAAKIAADAIRAGYLKVPTKRGDL